ASKLDRMERGEKPKGVDTGHRASRQNITNPILAELVGVDLHDEVLMRERETLHGETVHVVQRSAFHLSVLEVLPELANQGPTGYAGGWRREYERRTGVTLDRMPELRGARLATQAEMELFGYPDADALSAPVLDLYT